jgi:hypothetical protein
VSKGKNFLKHKVHLLPLSLDKKVNFIFPWGRLDIGSKDLVDYQITVISHHSILEEPNDLSYGSKFDFKFDYKRCGSNPRNVIETKRSEKRTQLVLCDLSYIVGSDHSLHCSKANGITGVTVYPVRNISLVSPID